MKRWDNGTRVTLRKDEEVRCTSSVQEELVTLCTVLWYQSASLKLRPFGSVSVWSLLVELQLKLVALHMVCCDIKIVTCHEHFKHVNKQINIPSPVIEISSF
jgi:hypothetical protein